MYSSYRITFDSAGSWNFDDTARTVVVLGVDNSSSDVGNCKNNFLVLVEVPTFWINRRFGSQEKKVVLILLKQIQNFVWVCIIRLIIGWFVC